VNEEKMRVLRLVFPEKGRCEIEEIELDESLKSGQILVRNIISLISSGTELAMFMQSHRGFSVEDFGYAKYPFYPGYSAIGEVIAAADDVSTVFIGDTVRHSGQHATFAKVSSPGFFKIPREMDLEVASFYTMSTFSITALHKAPPKFGEQVVVVGMGVIGNLAAQIYKLSGAAVVAGVDFSESRLEIANRVEAIDLSFDINQKPLEEWVSALGQHGAELVIDAVGSESSINACMKSVVDNGRVVLLGCPRVKMLFDPYFDIHWKGVHVIGAHGRSISSETRARDKDYILSLLQFEKLNVKELITHRVPFLEAQNAYEGLRDRIDEFLAVILQYSD
jgi:2-desacetyl-2-hydroxyethyl bacteriochlorophyllide A dehydrogenase